MLDAKIPVDINEQTTLLGQIEGVQQNVLVGWACDIARFDEAIQIGVRVGSQVIGAGLADRARADLQKAGFGSGKHGFAIRIEVPFFSGQKVQLELFDSASNKTIAAIPFSLSCRDPSALNVAELDSRSVHGVMQPRQSLRQRRLEAVMAPVLKPIRKIRQRCARKMDLGLPPGTQAKLSRIENLSVSSLSSISNWPRLTLPVLDDASDSGPSVSIIIPAHNQFQLTYQCLTSLILSDDRAKLEIIVVDDASTDATTLIETRVDNLRVVRNEQNLGFLHSCNKAASMAKGDYIVFLNNDTEVEAKWIDQMLRVFEEFCNVGAVGAKLVYPDGRLQDAGGIVWESGTPWNVGHGKDRDDPEYNYVREVDYLTGAALMVSRDAWQAAGGFSEQYAPAYYEDTDLAFKLRAAGYRTLYCPQSTVIHYEGRSNGTDTASGIKHHQVLNADHFKSTWNSSFVKQGVEGVNLRREKDRNRGLRVLMVDNAFPRLGQDAGSYAAVQEIRLLLALGCKVTFLPNNLLHLGVHVGYLQRLGVECVHAPFHRSVSKFMERRAAEFDAVYVTRYTVAEKIIPLVRQFSSAKIIFNNADLHFLREMRTALLNGGNDLSSVSVTRHRELAVMTAADVVLSYSDVELEVISSHLLCSNKLFKCPWIITPQSNGKPLRERQGIAFLGGFGHPPNKAAMDWFLLNVMPQLRRRRPEITLHIWGSHLPQDSGWEKQPGVVLEGYAESLDDVFMNCLAFVAPLQAGAGIKGKVLDSLAYGVPTVLSPIAAEATGLIDGVSTLIAAIPEQWVSSIERLMDDPALWEDIRRNSTELRDTRYSFENGVEAMQEVFTYLGLDTSIEHQQVIGQ